LRYNGAVNTQTVLTLLFELRAVLDRLGENDSTILEALAHDIDRAVRLTDSCIAQLTEDSTDAPDAGEESAE
jgi:hypothetical protein